jgi:hypothetical protein
MKIKHPVKTKKGIAFAGCSFTWGQGLYYYSNLSTIKLPSNQNRYDRDLITYAQYKFLELVRFPRIVADYFNTFELVSIQNGGALQTIIHNWSNINSKPEPWHVVFNGRPPTYDPLEISTFVCQLTKWPRCDVVIEYEGKTYGPMQYMDMFDQEIFVKWLNHNKLSLDQYIADVIKEEVLKIKLFLQEVENKGIKVAILTWPDDLVDIIKNDNWLKERFIELKYENRIYSSIENLINEHAGMCIIGDHDFFIDPPKDEHPSLICHQVIADSIIDFLENKEYMT